MVSVPIVTVEALSAVITQLQTQVLDLLQEIDDLNRKVVVLDGKLTDIQQRAAGAAISQAGPAHQEISK
jgi:uncharacterized coiled-coil protein SlyX